MEYILCTAARQFFASVSIHLSTLSYLATTTMFRPSFARQAFRALNTPSTFALSSCPSFTPLRSLSSTVPRTKDNNDDKKDPTKDPIESATTRAPEGASGNQEGQFARTDEEIRIPYPDDAHQPRQYTAQGRGGVHFKRTLAQFSLEEKVTVVTGGARGLGLVMAQALVASGSDIAIVDLNSTGTLPLVNGLLGIGADILQSRRLRTRPRSW